MTKSTESSARYTEKDDVISFASEVNSLNDSVEHLNFRNNDELTPIVTQFKTIVFSQHENSVKVIKEHQYLLNTVLLMKEQIINENDKLKNDLKKLITFDPNRITFVYNCSGNFYIKQSSHIIRKQHEVRLSNNLRKLQCLETKLTYLELVVLEEKARANFRFRANGREQLNV